MADQTLANSLRDALYELCLDELPDVHVVNGPSYTDAAGTLLILGCDLDYLLGDNTSRSMTTRQEWVHATSGADRSETGEIRGVIVANSGDSDTTWTRGECARVLTTLATALRADVRPSDLPGLLWCVIEPREWKETLTAEYGAECALEFAAVYSAQF